MEISCISDLNLTISKLGVSLASHTDFVVNSNILNTYIHKEKYYQLCLKAGKKYLLVLKSCRGEVEVVMPSTIHADVAFELGIISHTDLQTERALRDKAKVDAELDKARSKVRAHGARALGVELTED